MEVYHKKLICRANAEALEQRLVDQIDTQAKLYQQLQNSSNRTHDRLEVMIADYTKCTSYLVSLVRQVNQKTSEVNGSHFVQL